MMPLPHRNTIKFFGMGKKKDYLLWHQSHGTFTALNKKFKVQMWSTVTGKILQSQEADPDEEAEKEEKEKNELKITYMRMKSILIPKKSNKQNNQSQGSTVCTRQASRIRPTCENGI